MQLGFVGLGKMGGNMVHRIHRDSDHQVVAFDFSSEEAPRAPCSSAPLTLSSLKSKATTSWSESRLMRATMLPPILPRPTNPI